jgi:hypothetical protein
LDRSWKAGSLPPPEPPGEFVSEVLRTDCARFLDELRAQIGRRRERPESTGWVPSRVSDPARPDVIAEDQSLPNSHSSHSGQ